MKENKDLIVQVKEALLPFLLGSFSTKSRNYVKGLLTRGSVCIDGVPETNYARTLHPGQAVSVQLQPSAPGQTMKIPIIFEDDDLIVIDKPYGMLSISTDREREKTAYHLVTSHVKSRSADNRIFVVHRLDRDTSGVLLFAKNESIKHKLQDAWDALVSHRGYTAVVEGVPQDPQGQVTSWLKQTKTLLVYSSKRQGDGKKATTSYQTIQTSGQYSLLDISLETGRKNQIRVHMNDLGHPIAGDKKYGATSNPLGRLGLHASRLALLHPASGQLLEFESKAPASFGRLCTQAPPANTRK